ncbi:uncharacterized protein LOC100187306 [Ciona intestinalis]
MPDSAEDKGSKIILTAIFILGAFVLIVIEKWRFFRCDVKQNLDRLINRLMQDTPYFTQRAIHDDVISMLSLVETMVQNDWKEELNIFRSKFMRSMGKVYRWNTAIGFLHSLDGLVIVGTEIDIMEKMYQITNAFLIHENKELSLKRIKEFKIELNKYIPRPRNPYQDLEDTLDIINRTPQPQQQPPVVGPVKNRRRKKRKNRR